MGVHPEQQDQIGSIPADHLTRITKTLNSTGYGDWGKQQVLDVWITEHRMRAGGEATDRLTNATTSLVKATRRLGWFTLALVAATVALVAAAIFH